MSNNNNESRELIAAELDLVAGGMPIYMKVEGVMEPIISSYSWGESQTGTMGYTYDIRQNKSV